MKVRAVKFGFYNHQRHPGDVFDFEGKPSIIWMEPVDDAAKKVFAKLGWKEPPKPKESPPPEKPTGDEPRTLASLSSGDKNVI